MTDAQQNALSSAVRPDDHRPRPGIERKRDAAKDSPRANVEPDVVETKRQQRTRREHVHGGYP